MKPIITTLVALTVFAATSFAHASVIVFEDSFESPDVTGITTTVPDGWVGSTQGFGSGNRGVADVDSGAFTTPAGAQAAYTNFFDNAGLVTQEGAIGDLRVSELYVISFRVAKVAGEPDRNYLVGLHAIPDGTARNDVRGPSKPGTLLASASGVVTTSDMSELVTFTYIASPGDASIGQDLAVVIKSRDSNEVFFDDVIVTVPEPASLALLSAGSLLIFGRRK